MGERLPTNPIRRIGEFAPWWIKCRDCGDLAVMSPDWGKRSCEFKCKNCRGYTRFRSTGIMRDKLSICRFGSRLAFERMCSGL